MVVGMLKAREKRTVAKNLASTPSCLVLVFALFFPFLLSQGNKEFSKPHFLIRNYPMSPLFSQKLLSAHLPSIQRTVLADAFSGGVYISKGDREKVSGRQGRKSAEKQ